MKIGVFDSGVGGLSVLNSLKKNLPDNTYVFKNDSKHIPYGTKTKDQLLSYVSPIMDEFIAEGCELVVIACNTVTTMIISELRERVAVPLIGLEPMLKPAAKLTASNKIIMCATPGTLQSERYKYLKNEYARGIVVYEPDCSDWAGLIEDNQLASQIIMSSIIPGLDNGADVVVLGCTHYHWIEEDVREIAASYGADVLQPEAAVTAEVKRVIARLR